jgi:hypothetical protein
MGKPVIALAGRVEAGSGVGEAFDLARGIAPPGTSLEESMAKAGEWLELAARETAEWLRRRIPG